MLQPRVTEKEGLPPPAPNSLTGPRDFVWASPIDGPPRLRKAMFFIHSPPPASSRSARSSIRPGSRVDSGGVAGDPVRVRHMHTPGALEFVSVLASFLFRSLGPYTGPQLDKYRTRNTPVLVSHAGSWSTSLAASRTARSFGSCTQRHTQSPEHPCSSLHRHTRHTP